MTQWSEIEWRKYPDQIPELDKPLLLWDGKDVFEGHWFGPTPQGQYFFSAADTSRCDYDAVIMCGIKSWCYMPKGPR